MEGMVQLLSAFQQNPEAFSQMAQQMSLIAQLGSVATGSSSHPSHSSPSYRQSYQPPAKRQKQSDDDDIPRQLPLDLISQYATAQERLDVCTTTFEMLLQTHDAESSGVSLIYMIRKLVMEVNEIFGDDEISLKFFAEHLRQNPWFAANQQVVKWQESKKRVNISKISPSTPGFQQRMAEKGIDLKGKGKGKGIGIGKGISEVTHPAHVQMIQQLLRLQQQGH
mmetsp:Transcript_47561/g.75235  ORF Transcript_47561/g.75235 Transcript_47561/m.75235 type:complete len:223 (-) Transcript_47561:42-710(-)|eukprot:CAMPEP_0169068104 /NCGR_PEP_ID=MMETSP1015-20121227/3843_1 /TAXON_ID=342587 /ORGANISM="Karlodinium micrum, Strain CCMP2283" /LENGTH=222 /DNA_ID=CAMNT_0009126891 /DNA_START=60 /DNA_END=728 /DNA_ORIENTATION=-